MNHSQTRRQLPSSRWSRPVLTRKSSWNDFSSTGVSLCLACLLGAAAPVLSAPPGGKVVFNRDIRPLLVDKCFACHGPDVKKAKGDLRLDLPESANRLDADGRGPIVPGKPEASELVERLYTADKSKVMPPPKFLKKLTEADKQLLKQWVAEGAEFQKHWAFNPPVRPAVPSVKNGGWPRNSIDHFVLARLDKEGLQPSPEADRATLIRRRDARPDRPAAHACRGRRLPGRHLAGRL